MEVCMKRTLSLLGVGLLISCVAWADSVFPFAASINQYKNSDIYINETDRNAYSVSLLSAQLVSQGQLIKLNPGTVDFTGMSYKLSVKITEKFGSRRETQI